MRKNWKNDKRNTQVGFSATHLLISGVHGSFNAFNVSLISKKEAFTDAQIEVSAEIASINTNVEICDKNLISSYYFDAKKFPQLTFKSESLIKMDYKKYKLKGLLTMHGMSKQVILDVIFNGTAFSPVNKMTVAGFKITGLVKRSDFKLGEETSAAAVSDEVKIEVDAEFFKSPN